MSGQDDEGWKQEYERLQNAWKTESAAARERAETNREKWSKIREEEGGLGVEGTATATQKPPAHVSMTLASSPASAQLSSTSTVFPDTAVVAGTGA